MRSISNLVDLNPSAKQFMIGQFPDRPLKSSPAELNDSATAASDPRAKIEAKVNISKRYVRNRHPSMQL
jgi:hypothetical protein